MSMGSGALTFGSLFTGIGGFDVGLERAGMKCVWQVERDKHCNSVLERHWPGMQRLDDVRDVSTARLVRPDWICGGFPCQDLSVAGKRAGLAGARSGLFFEFVRIIREFRPGGVLIENVPGLLSSNERRDMGIVLGSLAELGYGFAYRVYDAQYFRVAQRRRRVFIVGCLGGWRRAAEILFESESLPWNPAPSRAKGSQVARAVARGAVGSGYRYDANGEDFVTHALTANGFDASEDGTGSGTPIIPILEVSGGTSSRGAGPNGVGIGTGGDPMFTLQSRHQHAVAYRTSGNCGVTEQGDKTAALNCATDPAQNIIVAGFKRGQGSKARSDRYQVEQSPTLTSSDSGTQQSPGVQIGMSVRRLTPRECERLQGFDDDWTRWTAGGVEIADGPRYRMVGNAVVPAVAEWIGARIPEVKGI